MKKLVIFDLDHTLVPMDTGDCWVRFLVEKGRLDPEPVFARLREFATRYRARTLDINDFVTFQMQFLSQFKRVDLDAWLSEYLQYWVKPAIPQKSIEIVQGYVDEGHDVALCTATYRYVTAPIGRLMGIANCLAMTPKTDESGEFVGEITDFPTYQEGKIRAVQAFVGSQKEAGVVYDQLVFYSDSINDRPLFDFVQAQGGECVAVNADKALSDYAMAHDWSQITTYEEQALELARKPHYE